MEKQFRFGMYNSNEEERQDQRLSLKVSGSNIVRRRSNDESLYVKGM